MAAYTEGALDKLSKKELIGITLSLQNRVEQYSNVNTDALEEIRKFNKNFVKLECEINIVKQVNTLLNKRVIDMERQCWANAQYSRRECLEVSGISRDFPTRSWNQKCSKSSVKLVVRSSLGILRHVIISQTLIGSLSNFCEEKIVIRSCQLRRTSEKLNWKILA